MLVALMLVSLSPLWRLRFYAAGLCQPLAAAVRQALSPKVLLPGKNRNELYSSNRFEVLTISSLEQLI
jgi:hypothetical protein